MKISSLFKLIAAVCMPCLAALVHGQALDSLWRLRVMDTDNLVKVEATIRFSNEPAMSCMSGDWKRIVIETKNAQAEDFFPLDSPLAYQVEHGVLTLGRTYVCDGYLLLTGKPESPIIRGDYKAVGWGSKKMGSFSLQRTGDDRRP